MLCWLFFHLFIVILTSRNNIRDQGLVLLHQEVHLHWKVGWFLSKRLFHLYVRHFFKQNIFAFKFWGTLRHAYLEQHFFQQNIICVYDISLGKISIHLNFEELYKNLFCAHMGFTCVPWTIGNRSFVLDHLRISFTFDCI